MRTSALHSTTAQQPTQNTSGVCNLIHKPPEGCAHLARTERRSRALSGQVVEVVCCRMTEMQAGLYTHFLTSNAARRLLSGQKAARVLSAITGAAPRVARRRAARNACRNRMPHPDPSYPCTA